MKLFSEFESCYYEAFTKMLCKPPMSESEAKDFIEQNIEVGVDFILLNELLSKDEFLIKKKSKSKKKSTSKEESTSNYEYDRGVFYYDKEKKVFKPNVNADMPIILNKIEMEALKNLIDMDVAEGFLEKSTLENLKSKLKDDEKGWSIDDIKYKRQYADGDKGNIEDINKKLKVLLKAIKQKCAVKCDYIGNDGKKRENKAIYPLKIEYSTINDKYRLYSFKKMPEYNQYIKMNLSGIRNLEILEDNLRDEDENFLKFNEKNTETVRLYVDPEKHVLERCFRLFSFYDRRAVYSKEKNVYILDIDYYKHDDKEVIKNILSLGSRVVVKSPEHIRDIVVSRVKKAIENY